MAMAVQKYGGSSLSDADKVRRVARRIAECHRAGRPTVVVVSARGNGTDALMREAAAVSRSRSLRELDQLLVTGEHASAALLALALHDLGLPAVSLTAAQARIVAAGRHGAGIIATVDPRRIVEYITTGQVVVVTGFQGIAANGDVLTLGRGGSDTTAVALAAALDAGACEIYTDVDGIYSADPRLVPDARLLPAVDVGVMAEMAFAGAQVLHPRAVELAAVRRVDLLVRNSMTVGPGTTILGRSNTDMMETEGFVTAVVHDGDVAAITVDCRRPAVVVAAEVAAALAGKSVPVDMMSWSDPADEGTLLRFAVRRSHLPEVTRALHDAVAAGNCRVTVNEDVGKLSVVGIGLFSRPEYTAQVLYTLTAAGIAAGFLSSTQLRISVLVPRCRLDDGVRALHRVFRLGQLDLPAGRLASV